MLLNYYLYLADFGLAWKAKTRLFAYREIRGILIRYGWRAFLLAGFR